MRRVLIFLAICACAPDLSESGSDVGPDSATGGGQVSVGGGNASSTGGGSATGGGTAATGGGSVTATGGGAAATGGGSVTATGGGTSATGGGTAATGGGTSATGGGSTSATGGGTTSATGGGSGTAGTDCSADSVRCVDDTPGPTREYTTIQAATNAAKPGDTVLVFAGHYTGFQIRSSGTPAKPLTFRAAEANVVIDSPIPAGQGVGACVSDATGICIVGVGDLEGLHDLVIDGFRIENMGMRCVASHEANPGFVGTSTPHQRITIRALTCVNAGHEGLYLSELYDSLIENNEVLNAGANGAARGHGIYLANAGCDRTTLRGNFIHWEGKLGPVEGAGIHFNGDSSVDGNGGGDGLITDLVIENNVIRGSRHNGLNMDGVQSSMVRNNVISNVGRNGIVVYAIDAAEGAKAMRIVNNTFVVPANSGGAAIKLEDDLGGHTIFNNVLVNLAGGACVSVGNTSFASDFNACAGTFELNEATQKPAQWAHDAHSLAPNPNDVFVSATDFHLKAASAAIDVGVASFNAVLAPVVDCSQVSRPRGTGFDLGAYER